MKMKLLLFMGILFCFGEQGTLGQVDSTGGRELTRIVKIDGTEYIGYIISDDGREILIETGTLGKIFIPKSEIKSITPLKSGDFNKEGKFDPEGPFSTRYYFTNTALPAKKGDHYAMIHLYGPEVHFAAGKGFNIGIMTSWGASPFVLVARQGIRTKSEKIHLSLGTMFGSSGYLNTFRGWGGMHWGTAAIGDSKNNFSFGGGYLYVQPGFENVTVVTANPGIYPDTIFYSSDLTSTRTSEFFKTPMFSLAGIVRLNQKISFIFDSMLSIRNKKSRQMDWSYSDLNSNGYSDYGEGYWTVSENDEMVTMFFLMPGMRIQGSDNSAFQVALAGVTVIRDGNTIAFPIPQCSWFLKF